MLLEYEKLFLWFLSSEFSIFSNFQQWVYISFITLKNTNYTLKIISLCFLRPYTALVIKARHHLPVIHYWYFLTDPLALSCILCWNLCNQLYLFPYQYLILAVAFCLGFLIMSHIYIRTRAGYWNSDNLTEVPTDWLSLDSSPRWLDLVTCNPKQQAVATFKHLRLESPTLPSTNEIP